MLTLEAAFSQIDWKRECELAAFREECVEVMGEDRVREFEDDLRNFSTGQYIYRHPMGSTNTPKHIGRSYE